MLISAEIACIVHMKNPLLKATTMCVARHEKDILPRSCIATTGLPGFESVSVHYVLSDILGFEVLQCLKHAM